MAPKSSKAGEPKSDEAKAAKAWRPDYPVTYAPYADGGWLNVKNFLNYFFGYPGYLWPWTVIYVSVVVMTYTYAFPALENCKTFEAGWIIFVALRNLLLIWIFAGGWHMLLYTLKLQGKDGMDQKYDRKWPDANANKFMFGHQTYENVFVSCTSGVAVWTAYEVLFMNMWANDKISTVYYNFWGDSFADGAYSCLLILATPIWREFHFYWIHRFSHWKPFYKRVHYLHHKNTNPGPWSGLSMHPIEHILYFSVVIPHMFIPCHPIHFLFNLQHTALTPAGGHHGFEGPIVNGKIPTGSYFHYLHHRYFECNYGESTIPLDKWFGTFRDGQEKKGDSSLSDKAGEVKETQFVKVLTIAVGSALGVLPLVPLLKTVFGN